MMASSAEGYGSRAGLAAPHFDGAAVYLRGGAPLRQARPATLRPTSPAGPGPLWGAPAGPPDSRRAATVWHYSASFECSAYRHPPEQCRMALLTDNAGRPGGCFARSLRWPNWVIASPNTTMEATAQALVVRRYPSP